MKRLHGSPWHVRVALVLAGLWAVWLLAFVVWAWTLPELRSGEGPFGPLVPAARSYAVESAVILGLVLLGLAVAIWQPAWGGVGGGLWVALLAGIGGGGRGVNGLAHWGEVRLGDQARTTSWVPLDSVAGVPYWLLLAAGALLVVGGAAHLRYPMDGYVRAAFLLVAVWAVWLTAFAGWAMGTEELGLENTYMAYVVWAWFVALPAVATAMLIAIAWPRWGAIGVGLGMTLGAGQASRSSISALRDWGELTIIDSSDFRDRPWVLLDSIGLLPYWALLAAAVVLVVGGVAAVVRPRHHATPRTGAAT